MKGLWKWLLSKIPESEFVPPYKDVLAASESLSARRDLAWRSGWFDGIEGTDPNPPPFEAHDPHSETMRDLYRDGFAAGQRGLIVRKLADMAATSRERTFIAAHSD